AAAEISPRTFFRHFATKEEAVFPDHEERIAELRAQLEGRRNAISPLTSLLDLTLSLASQYMDDPTLYRSRFELVRDNPSLRDRERVIDYQYEMAVVDYLREEIRADDPATVITLAHAIAAAVVATVNAALEHWLDSSDAEALAVLECGLLLI